MCTRKGLAAQQRLRGLKLLVETGYGDRKRGKFPHSIATMAIAWPCPSAKSAFSHATTALTFTAGLSLPPSAKPLSVASLRKSAGL